jgi:tetratricopeptide (TPR) repeat protein
LNVLSQVASKFRTKVGESLASVREHETPLPEATTPSIEALDAYGKAERIAYSTGFIDAVPEVKRAIMLDGQFARAYSFLGDMYSAVGESVLAGENAAQAFKLRDRASDRERFSIDLIYYTDVTGDLEKAQETCKLWAQTYPRDVDPHGWLSAMIYQSMGKYEESIKEDGIALDIDSDFVPGYINLAYDYIFLDRLAEAENTLRRAAERKLEVPDILILEYELAFLKGDQAGADKIVARAQGTPGAEDWIAAEQAFVFARSGNLAKARNALDRAVQLAQGPALKERAGQYKAGGAVLEALFGNAREATQKSTEALALSKGRDTEYGAALALALAMDSLRAQQINR